MPASRARSSPYASGLFDPTHTISTAPSAWTVSISACRFEPSPDMSTPTRRLTPRRGRAPGAAPAGGRRGGRVAKVSEDRPAATVRTLDVRPDLPVLAPSDARRLGYRRPAQRLRATLEHAHQRAGHAVRRRGRGLHDPVPM